MRALGLVLLWSLFASCASPERNDLRAKKILAEERSPFGLVSVYDIDGKRHLNIGSQEQSAMDLIDKRRWVFNYTYMLSVAVLARVPDKVGKGVQCLVIGLGGGSFANFLADSFPDWNIHVVELDPVVIRLARQYFPINKNIRIIQADGRLHLQNRTDKYDLIVMDAFGAQFIPPALYTLEFFKLMKSRLKPKGMVLMNAWENEELDAAEIATLRRSFEKGYYIHHPDDHPGNRIYLLAKELETDAVLKKRINERFAALNFPGESPQRILETMKSIHSGANRNAPITDATVREILDRTFGKGS